MRRRRRRLLWSEERRASLSSPAGGLSSTESCARGGAGDADALHPPERESDGGVRLGDRQGVETGKIARVAVEFGKFKRVTLKNSIIRASERMKTEKKSF